MLPVQTLYLKCAISTLDTAARVVPPTCHQPTPLVPILSQILSKINLQNLSKALFALKNVVVVVIVVVDAVVVVVVVVVVIVDGSIVSD